MCFVWSGRTIDDARDRFAVSARYECCAARNDAECFRDFLKVLRCVGAVLPVFVLVQTIELITEETETIFNNIPAYH